MNDPENIVYGLSPLGGNSVEGTSPADAEVRDTSISEVPLTYDPITGDYVSFQRAEEIYDEIVVSREKQRIWEEEQRFLNNVGYQTEI